MNAKYSKTIIFMSMFFALFLSANISSAGLSFEKSWYEITCGKIIVEFSDTKMYYAYFVDDHNELRFEEGLYRYSERFNTLSFSPMISEPRVKSMLYGKKFDIIEADSESLKIQNSQIPSELYVFEPDERHLKAGCRCSLCKKMKK